MSIAKWITDATKSEELIAKAQKIFVSHENFSHAFHTQDTIRLAYTYVTEPRKQMRDRRYDNCGRKRRNSVNGVAITVYDSMYRKSIELAAFKTKRELMDALNTEVSKEDAIKAIILKHARNNAFNEITINKSNIDEMIKEISNL